MSTSTPEPGCYVDSHWGQYAVARMVQVAAELGWEDEQASDLARRHLAAMGPSSEPGLVGDEFEELMGACDDAEDWLNHHATVAGHSWGWYEGDFGLYPNEEED